MSNGKTPVELMLDQHGHWAEVKAPANVEDGIPYATHAGLLEIGGHKLRCYRLSNGQSVFHADDVHKLFGVPEV